MQINQLDTSYGTLTLSLKHFWCVNQMVVANIPALRAIYIPYGTLSTNLFSLQRLHPLGNNALNVIRTVKNIPTFASFGLTILVMCCDLTNQLVRFWKGGIKDFISVQGEAIADDGGQCSNDLAWIMDTETHPASQGFQLNSHDNHAGYISTFPCNTPLILQYSVVILSGAFASTAIERFRLWRSYKLYINSSYSMAM